MVRFQFSRQDSNKQPPIKTSLDLRLWRVIGTKMCTLIEAQTIYNYTDILDMHEYLNIREYFEEKARENARKESEKVRARK